MCREVHSVVYNGADVLLTTGSFAAELRSIWVKGDGVDQAKGRGAAAAYRRSQGREALQQLRVDALHLLHGKTRAPAHILRMVDAVETSCEPGEVDEGFRVLREIVEYDESIVASTAVELGQGTGTECRQILEVGRMQISRKQYHITNKQI